MVNQTWKNKCLTLIGFARGSGNGSSAVPEHKTNMYLTQCQTSEKKKINREITISQPPPSIRFPGTSTRAINCHLAGVLLKLTNRSKTDWRSESINYNNFPLQPSGVWCCSTTGSECTPTQPMAPSGWAFNSSKCS